MFDRRIAVIGSTLYGAAIAGAAVAGAGTVLVVICVVGGPIVGMLYWGSSGRGVDERRRRGWRGRDDDR
jgi:hypothetical protein